MKIKGAYIMLNMVTRKVQNVGKSALSYSQKLLDALIDSAVVAGITTLSAGFLTNPEITVKMGLASFIMAFLVKLRSVREDGKDGD